jgi:Uma2 family endonuclease
MRRPLEPDVAYLSYARLPREDAGHADIPRIAPDAVVEVISPGDADHDIEEKIRVYLASGTSVVFLVDTDRQTIAVRDAEGDRIITRDAEVRHSSLAGFSMPARELFDEP